MTRSVSALCVFSAAMAVCLLSACGPSREKEPNEDAPRATLVRPGRIEGTISTPGDVDVYRVDVAQDGAVLSARVGGIRSIDFVLSVRDQERGELKRFDETSIGGDEEALDIGVKKGSYFIVVSNKNEKADNPQQPYALELRLEKGLGREREPDDNAQSASDLEVPGVTRGHYWPSRNLLSGDTDYMEADWYRIRVATGLFVLNLDLSEVPKVDPLLEVYDSNFYRLKVVDSGGVGAGETLKSFGLKGPVELFLRLVSKFRTGNAEAPYEILTELIPYQGRTEFEPNDQRTDATPFDGDSITGTIAPEGDSDWYRVHVAEDKKLILRAAVTAIEGADLVLKICDAFGNPIVAADNVGKGQPEAITGVGLTPGDYYLVVSEKSGRVADARASYTLSKSVTPFEPGLEYEPNESAAAAQPLKIGESTDAYLAPAGDQDYYQFNAYQSGPVLVEVAGVMGVRLTVALFDQDEKELGSWGAAKLGDPLSFEKKLEAGTYFLRVKAAAPDQSNVRDKYSLRLKAQ